MINFEKIHFHGEFRDYQSRVLKNAKKYLADGKINIVAAPGSGKTVLGLELIRMIGKPCIIFSPTAAIREQWGERLKDLFLEDKEDFPLLFSTSLYNIKLINSVTYQALFSAMDGVDSEDGDESFSDVDIVSEIRKNKISVICLDEAHHLKNEWQKALEKLLSLIGKELTVIALTATPPYDSEGNEWNRYLSLCGEVDEEIFVPELVSKDTLCPHQDYIYFNYPSKNETAAVEEYRKAANLAVEEAVKQNFIAELCKSLNEERDFDKLFTSAKSYTALLILFNRYGFNIKRKLIRTMVGVHGLPSYNLAFAEEAFRFLLSADLLNTEQKDILVKIFKDRGVYSKKRLELSLNEKCRRTLISSVGKLTSIGEIVKSEYESLDSKLRMLILTDYIKKEDIGKAAFAKSFESVSIVSIFETVRRTSPNVSIAVLSGSLIILPDSIAIDDSKHTRTPIADTHYSIVEIQGKSAFWVKLVGELFESGKIEVLIGTKSLLGEGWDAPVINSLILASFVGSYVLSNQMRGRAIRRDTGNPEKSANIWHLVTLEPPHLFKNNIVDKAKAYVNRDENELVSCDYDILKRRFDTFIGPDYESGTIESGIERIKDIKPPYNKDGVAAINQSMLNRSKDREKMKAMWSEEVKDGKFNTVTECEIERVRRIPVYTFYNFLLIFTLSLLQICLIRDCISSAMSFITLNLGLLPTLFLAAAAAAIAYAEARIVKKIFMHINPARSFKTLGLAVYKTLLECGLISPSAKLEATGEKRLDFISLYLRNASIHDQNIFNTAMAEMLSPIDNPRYILIKKLPFGKFNYRHSLACPDIIGRKKEYAELLAKELKASTGNYTVVYTRSEGGRALILKCRKRSYITKTKKAVDKKYKVRRWE